MSYQPLSTSPPTNVAPATPHRSAFLQNLRTSQLNNSNSNTAPARSFSLPFTQNAQQQQQYLAYIQQQQSQSLPFSPTSTSTPTNTSALSSLLPSSLTLEYQLQQLHFQNLQLQEQILFQQAKQNMDRLKEMQGYGNNNVVNGEGVLGGLTASAVERRRREVEREREVMMMQAQAQAQAQAQGMIPHSHHSAVIASTNRARGDSLSSSASTTSNSPSIGSMSNPPSLIISSPDDEESGEGGVKVRVWHDETEEEEVGEEERRERRRRSLGRIGMGLGGFGRKPSPLDLENVTGASGRREQVVVVVSGGDEEEEGDGEATPLPHASVPLTGSPPLTTRTITNAVNNNTRRHKHTLSNSSSSSSDCSTRDSIGNDSGFEVEEAGGSPTDSEGTGGKPEEVVAVKKPNLQNQGLSINIPAQVQRSSRLRDVLEKRGLESPRLGGFVFDQQQSQEVKEVKKTLNAHASSFVPSQQQNQQHRRIPTPPQPQPQPITSSPPFTSRTASPPRTVVGTVVVVRQPKGPADEKEMKVKNFELMRGGGKDWESEIRGVGVVGGKVESVVTSGKKGGKSTPSSSTAPSSKSQTPIPSQQHQQTLNNNPYLDQLNLNLALANLNLNGMGMGMTLEQQVQLQQLQALMGLKMGMGGQGQGNGREGQWRRN